MGGDARTIGFSGAHILAALNQHRPHPEFDEAKGGKKTRRSGTHHDGRTRITHIGIGDALVSQRRRRFVDPHFDGEIDVDGALARINATADNACGADFIRLHTELRGNMRAQLCSDISDIGSQAELESGGHRKKECWNFLQNYEVFFA